MSTAVLPKKSEKKSVERAPQRKSQPLPFMPRILVSLRLRRDVYSNLATHAAMERQHVRSGNGGYGSPIYMQEIVDAAIEMYLRKRNAWPAPAA